MQRLNSVLVIERNFGIWKEEAGIMIPIPYSRLVVYAVVSVATSFLVTTFRVSIWILDGIHTYIYPENVGNGSQGNVRAAIRRPGTDMNGQDATSTMASGNRDAVDSSASNLDEREIGSRRSGENQAKVKGKLKERPKRDAPKGSRWKKETKEKFAFDETNAQMFRLRLGDSQLQSRQYFTEYDEAIIYASLGLSNLLTHQFLPEWSSSDDKQSAVMFFRGDLVPFLVGLYAIYKLARLLGRMSLEKSASKNSEQLLSIFVGFVGFLVSLTILSVFAPGSVDLRVGSTSTAESKKNEGSQVTFLFGFMKFFLAIFAGWLCGLLFSPAHKAVRSFWLGTDQLKWNLSVIGSGKLTRTLFYLNIVMPVFTSLLWIKPMADIFILQSNEHQRFSSCKSRSFPSDLDGVQKIQAVNTGTLKDPGHQKNMVAYMEEAENLEASAPFLSHHEHILCQRQNGEISSSMKSQNPGLGSSDFDIVNGEGEDTKWYFWRRFYSSHQENWTQQIGMPAEVFEQFRVWCLLCTAVLQLLLLRPNLQMYLNEAVLIWYQRLHGSRDPNLDFSRAKLFLHNYFICQVALQFFIPATLVLLFVGLSQIRGSISGGLSLPGSFLFSSSFFQEAALFMAWWVQFVWAVLTCSNLALYRLGFLIVS